MIKDLRPQRGKHILPEMIEEGEHVGQDFKFAISDARKIARSISAFANHDGGRLLVGVKDNGAIAGVRSDEDIYVVEQAAQMYCQPPQDINVKAYQVEGAVVYVVEIAAAGDGRPAQVKEAGGKPRAYYRVADENVAAHPLMVRAWRARRNSLEHDSGHGRLITADEQRLLAAISDNAGSIHLDDLPKHIKASLTSTRQAVINAYSLGLVDFDHDADGFVIVAR
ncbi:MAG: ATP-binding protein [Muribaculaceae bacterium]|nr:ATP-binding protein [Muribaculaceae bacterium]